MFNWRLGELIVLVQQSGKEYVELEKYYVEVFVRECKESNFIRLIKQRGR